MHCITDDEFAEEAEEEEIKEQAKQTTQTEPTMSAQPGKGKTGPKAKAKNSEVIPDQTYTSETEP